MDSSVAGPCLAVLEGVVVAGVAVVAVGGGAEGVDHGRSSPEVVATASGEAIDLDLAGIGEVEEAWSDQWQGELCARRCLVVGPRCHGRRRIRGGGGAADGDWIWWGAEHMERKGGGGRAQLSKASGRAAAVALIGGGRVAAVALGSDLNVFVRICLEELSLVARAWGGGSEAKERLFRRKRAATTALEVPWMGLRERGGALSPFPPLFFASLLFSYPLCKGREKGGIF